MLGITNLSSALRVVTFSVACAALVSVAFPISSVCCSSDRFSVERAAGDRHLFFGSVQLISVGILGSTSVDLYARTSGPWWWSANG
jgi:hypothetical protein